MILDKRRLVKDGAVCRLVEGDTQLGSTLERDSSEAEVICICKDGAVGLSVRCAQALDIAGPTRNDCK